MALTIFAQYLRAITSDYMKLRRLMFPRILDVASSSYTLIFIRRTATMLFFGSAILCVRVCEWLFVYVGSALGGSFVALPWAACDKNVCCASKIPWSWRTCAQTPLSYLLNKQMGDSGLGMWGGFGSEIEASVQCENQVCEGRDYLALTAPPSWRKVKDLDLRNPKHSQLRKGFVATSTKIITIEPRLWGRDRK